MSTSLWISAFLFFSSAYCIALSRRLRGPHPLAKPIAPPTEEELDSVTYDGIDILKAIPTEPTQRGYAVIGGSGFLGMYIVRLLLLRGETNIRILDLEPPYKGSDVAAHPSVTFARTDIASLASVRAALTLPFPSTNAPPSVIYHAASIIRFWERASYTWDISYKVNVIGTDNILTVARELPSAILIYTSSSDAVKPRPKFARLGWDYHTSPWNKISISDNDPPLPLSQLGESCYARSKLLAERRVIASNGKGNLTTGVIRPGCSISGPNDRLYSSTLVMPTIPIFDSLWSQTNVCVWDAAAAQLLLEDALRKKPDEVSGQGFLVTGNGPAWRLRESRDIVKYYSKRPLVFCDVSPLLIYILSHLVESLLFVRYYVLLPLYWLFGSRPRVSPAWLGELTFLQPATLEYMVDLVIDDSRARKVLGYRPQWETTQVIKWAVDQVQSGTGRQDHGIQIK